MKQRYAAIMGNKLRFVVCVVLLHLNWLHAVLECATLLTIPVAACLFSPHREPWTVGEVITLEPLFRRRDGWCLRTTALVQFFYGHAGTVRASPNT
jgi:hypothetical protein